METSDDAGVYRINDDTAIIQTLDFITPVTDDPFIFGQAAACNGLSDVYAMGGKPITVMNIVCFPTGTFSIDVLEKILSGGMDIIRKSGAQLLGGHSVDDVELKYGISVTGIVHPDRVIRNRSIMAGDSLVLTKPLGTGIISTVVKAGSATDKILKNYNRSITALNDRASAVMREFSVHACTDVTGFGLAGHLKEMLGVDDIEIVIESKNIPLLPGALENAAAGFIPGGTYRNRDFVGGLCRIDKSVKRELADIIFDPQTSGGLLIAVPEKDAVELQKRLAAEGVTDAAVIGNATGGSHGIRVI
jgi:selenide,water dikinase